MTLLNDGARVLITGGTGFVGQAVLEKLLSAYPGTRVTLLVRPRGERTGADRVASLLRKACFARWREEEGEGAIENALANRIDVLEGDLTDVPALPDDLDVVIHSASSVSFDLPIDEAFEANVGGPKLLYQALRASGSDPHVIHVSTSYVAGLRKGVALEESLDHTVDAEAELDQAYRARGVADARSRTADALKTLISDATKEHRRAGAIAVSKAVEEGREGLIRDELVEVGRARAQSLGWPDVYTFTKALGERMAEQLWAPDHRLSVVRPTIIESSLRHPRPGWIDGFKVADPLIAAYGRGMLPEFPALADTVLDVIPVDFIVNAILAAADTPPEPGAANYYQVGSGVTNPLRFGRLYRLVREYFKNNPLLDSEGLSVNVPQWSFPHGPAIERALRRREFAVEKADQALAFLPTNARTQKWTSGVYKARRDLRTLRKFTELYEPYTRTETTFDDAATRALHAAIPDERKERDGFDVNEIDWREYLQDIHIPNVPGLMRQRSGTSVRRRPAVLPAGDNIVAVFDLQRTIASATPVEHLLWVELNMPASRWPKSLVDVFGRLPQYLQADQRDRGEFIRTIMRRYQGINDAELRALVKDKVAPSLRANVNAEALKQIAAHRQAGHTTVLVTGEIDVFVEPLHELFDHIEAGSMEVDPAGNWTGHLAHSPLVGEARASWLRRTADAHGWDLARSYAYGDSYADRAWLEVVGNPTAVNPDAALYRHAKANRWNVENWTTKAQSRAGAVISAVKGGRKS